MGSHSRYGIFPRWGWIMAAAAMVSAPAMPAQADELADWNYDLETRSLTLSLPQNVVPSISVVAPDRLLLELPNTQVGETTGQTVDDGLVESITLEQTTPDTVWMIVDFAPGTVLADSQSASPSADDASQPSLQQWQVRPALLASSRSTDSVASAEPAADELEPATENSAASLRPPAVDLAQAPDFSDLPVLEPAMPINEPVSVPPLDAPLAEAEPDETTEPVADSAPAVEAAPIEVPVINASEPEAPEPDIEAASEEPDVSEQPVANSPADEEASSEVGAALPAEPPFLGEIGTADTATDLPSEPPIAVGDLEESLPAIEADAAKEPEPIAEAEPEADTAEVSIPEADIAESDVVETAPSQEIAEVPPAPALEEAVVEEAIVEEAPLVDIPAEITPANVNRWPEPIPFGQPLP
jgi:hypothetical protein